MFSTEIHLFIFRRQHVSLRFAAADRDVPIGEHTYTAAAIARDAIRQGAERAKDKLKIRMAASVAAAPPPGGWPSTQALANWWRPHIPSDPITVICLRYDPDSGKPPSVEWTGWAMQPVYTDSELELTCDPNPPAGSALSQGAKWGRSCFKVVYSTGPRGCNLDPEEFEIAATAAGKSGLTLQSDDLIGTPFTLAQGWITWTRDDGIVEERPIQSHNQSTGVITVLWDGVDLAVGTEVTALPNCPGTWAACAARRADPQNHYGGSVHKPVRDPIASGRSMTWD